jgi:putative transcriptional regulator
MNITHHPSDATLAAFAAGTLDEGRSLVVATHLSLCAQCRNGLRAFEHVGGALLDGLEPAVMRAGALQNAMAQIGRIEIDPPVMPAPRASVRSGLPAPLSEYALGPWRWIGRGVHRRSAAVPSEQGSRVFMLKAAPGTRLLHHRHVGTEWTCVFQGAFRHDLGRFGPGDFDEADESAEHKPVVEDGDTCICLVALQGSLQLQGWFGRLLQPFVRV